MASTWYCFWLSREDRICIARAVQTGKARAIKDGTGNRAEHSTVDKKNIGGNRDAYVWAIAQVWNDCVEDKIANRQQGMETTR